MNNQKLYRGVGLISRYHKLDHSSKRSWQLMLKPICASTEIELTNWIKEKPVKKKSAESNICFLPKIWSRSNWSDLAGTKRRSLG